METTNLPNIDSLSALVAASKATHAEHLRRLEEAQDELSVAHEKLATVEKELVALTQKHSAALAALPDLPTHATATSGVSLILNPAAKSFVTGSYSPEAIVAALRMVGIAPQVELTTAEINAYQLASKAVDRGDTLVIAAGGDGTIEEVAMALIHRPVTLGILPLGTMNNLARALGIPLDLPNAALLLAIGATRHVDVGRVITPDDRLDGYFLETAGIGLSALAAPMGEDMEKGRWTDLFSKLGQLFGATSVGVTLHCDDDTILQAQTHTVTIANAPLFGANMLIAPDAKIDDGLLDIAIYSDMELVDLTRYFVGISSAGRFTDTRVHSCRARRVRVTADAPLAVNADLDVLAEQHTWEVEVMPRALSVVVGNGPALTFPMTDAPVAPPLAGPQVIG